MQHAKRRGNRKGKKTPQMVKRKEMGSSAVVSEQSWVSLRPTFCWEASHRPRPRSEPLVAAAVRITRIWSLEVTLRGHHIHHFACRGGQHKRAPQTLKGC